MVDSIILQPKEVCHLHNSGGRKSIQHTDKRQTVSVGAKRKATKVIGCREGTQGNKAMVGCCGNNRGKESSIWLEMAIIWG